MKALKDPKRALVERCEADVTPLSHEGYRGGKLYQRDLSARCRRIASYEHEGRKLCHSHAANAALEVVLGLEDQLRSLTRG